jgi:hypothetical protein
MKRWHVHVFRHDCCGCSEACRRGYSRREILYSTVQCSTVQYLIRTDTDCTNAGLAASTHQRWMGTGMPISCRGHDRPWPLNVLVGVATANLQNLGQKPDIGCLEMHSGLVWSGLYRRPCMDWTVLYWTVLDVSAGIEIARAVWTSVSRRLDVTVRGDLIRRRRWGIRTPRRDCAMLANVENEAIHSTSLRRKPIWHCR